MFLSLSFLNIFSITHFVRLSIPWFFVLCYLPFPFSPESKSVYDRWNTMFSNIIRSIFSAVIEHKQLKFSVKIPMTHPQVFLQKTKILFEYLFLSLSFLNIFAITHFVPLSIRDFLCFATWLIPFTLRVRVYMICEIQRPAL